MRRKPKPAPVDVPLTPKQRLLVEWYTSAECNLNGLEAARRAGYSGTDKALAVTATRTLHKPNVAAAVEAKMRKALAGAEVTVEAVLRRLTVLGEEARAAGQFASATRCTELHGKYLKMFTDRIEHVASIEDVSTDQLTTLLREIAERSNIDFSGILAGNAAGERRLPDPAGAPKAH